MITVVNAPPFATVQDLGRTGFRDIGVPVSGIADRDSGHALNSLLGNEANAAMIEWAVAGGDLRFDVDGAIALGGAEASCTINGHLLMPWTTIEVARGDTLHIERIVRRRFLLIAIRGGIDVPVVMGSRSTLLSAGLGGFKGRRLKNGDELRIARHEASTTAIAAAVASPRARRDGDFVHVMRGPQAHHFDEAAWATFLGTEFSVSRSSDRTGYRLEGATVSHNASGTLPSEPACVGAVQIPENGQPIVIMPDGPTIGGYPKIAVIRASSMSDFAQLAPGDPVRFVLDATLSVPRSWHGS
jgi:antagonist of KipI